MNKGITYSAGASYNKKVKQVKNTTILEGINSYGTSVMFTQAENSYGAYADFNKRFNGFRANMNVRYTNSEFYQLVNDVTTKNQMQIIDLRPSITSQLNDKWPEMELGFSQSFSNYKTSLATSKYNASELFATLEYNFLEDFLLKADYKKTYYINNSMSIHNTFDTANASLLFQQEDSPWGVEVSCTNLFYIAYRQENSFSDYLITDSKTYLMPRIGLLKLIYKF